MDRIALTQSLNRWICRAAPFLIICAFALAILSGCGGGGGDSSSTTDTFEIDAPATPATTAEQPTTTSKNEKDDSSGSNAYGGGGSGDTIKPVGAVPACNSSTLSPAVKAWGKKQGSNATLAAPNYKCADGWAIALVNVGPVSQGFISTVVFVARDGSWSPQERKKVCSQPSPVPTSLYQLGCNSN